MKVSDKDFDQLFNNKLGNMEIEPSANVWNNIADELDGKVKNKKGGLSFMQIAAGIVVLMGVSLLFIRPQTKTIALHASASQTNVNLIQNSSSTMPVPQNFGTEEVTAIAVVAPKAKHEPKVTAVQTQQTLINSSADTGAKTTDYIASTGSQTDKIQPQQTTMDVKPDITPAANTSSSIVPAHINIEPVKPATTKPVLAAAVQTSKITEPAKRKRIRSLGDLLNVVIAKVDKREDKLIEFTNDSDDDSFNVTGVNLGLIKAKKEN